MMFRLLVFALLLAPANILAHAAHAVDRGQEDLVRDRGHAAVPGDGLLGALVAGERRRLQGGLGEVPGESVQQALGVAVGARQARLMVHHVIGVGGGEQ